MVSPFEVATDGLRLSVRLAPNASTERIIGLAAEADGGVALKIAVTAAPEAGKANDALLALLARLLGVPKRALTLLRGAGDRRKLVHVTGDPNALARRFAEILRPWSRG
jgi:uncharacterized protein YggU (UPF0235/DUF167 family)